MSVESTVKNIIQLHASLSADSAMTNIVTDINAQFGNTVMPVVSIDSNKSITVTLKDSKTGTITGVYKGLRQ